MLDLIPKEQYRTLFLSILSIIFIGFPFTERTEGVVFNREMFSIPDNEMIKTEVVPFVKKKFPHYADTQLYYDHPYLSLALDIDPFDVSKQKPIFKAFADSIPQGAVLIWDDWFSVKESGAALSLMQERTDLELMGNFKEDAGERVIQFVVFRKRRN